MHPERVELFGDAQLVEHAEIDALALRAVAQGGVVEREAWTGVHGGRKGDGICNTARAAAARQRRCRADRFRP